MSVERPDSLWQQVLRALAARGQLPRTAHGLTPAEIAQACGDERVRMFVEQFYYPVRYGATPGMLSEAQVALLVSQITGNVPRPTRDPPPTSMPSRAEPSSAKRAPTCSVCGWRRAEAGMRTPE